MAVSYKKLSDAINELDTTNKVSTDDYFVIYNQASTKRAAKKLSANELHIPYYINSFDNYDSLNDFLDTFQDLNFKNGKYRINIGGVPSYVTFEVRSSANKVYGQWIEGPAEPTNDGASLALLGDNSAVHICSRVYIGGEWQAWKEFSYKTDVPTVQTTANGNSKNYIVILVMLILMC